MSGKSERRQTVNGQSSEIVTNVDRSKWPYYDHSPKDADRARLYYFSKNGELLPSPEIAELIAGKLLTSAFEQKSPHLKIPERRKLTLVLTGEETFSKILLDTTQQMAIEKYGIDPDDIITLDRSPAWEKDKLRNLSKLLESKQIDKRNEYISDLEAKEYEAVDRVRGNGGCIIIREVNPKALEGFDPIDRKDLASTQTRSRSVRTNYEINWIVTGNIHSSVAEIDAGINPGKNVNYEDEMYVWLKACERPRAEVVMAQEKLKHLMNRARQVRIIASPQDQDFASDITFKTTRLSDDGNEVPRNWCNSVEKNNLPGSEVFGAPSKFSGEGTLAYPEPIMFDGYLLPNLVVTLKKGRVEDDWKIVTKTKEDERAAQYFADKMNDSEFPDNRYVGEIGIGTNPYLIFNSINIGVNEKRGIHIALGKCYDRRVDEAGDITDLNNGNKNANIHADLVLPPEKPLELWIDVGTGDKEEWLLVLKDGEFLKFDNGMYQADPDMDLLHRFDANKEPFSAEFPSK